MESPTTATPSSAPISLDSAFSEMDAEVTETADAPTDNAPSGSDPVDAPQDENSASPEDAADTPVEEEPPAEEKPAEDAPDDIKVRERANGAKEYVLREGRYRSWEQAHKVAQASEQILGQPLTPELIQELRADYVAQRSMVQDFLSPEPQDQGRFLSAFAQMALDARDNGMIDHDPFISLAEQFIPFIEKNSPEAMKRLEAPVTERVIGNLKRIAAEQARAGQKDLLYSLQYIERALYNRFTPEADLLRAEAAPDPLEARDRSLTERENAMRQEDLRRAQNEFNTWRNSANTDIRNTISTVITDTMKAFEAGKESLAYEAATGRLDKLFRAAVAADPQFVKLCELDMRKAAQARSPEMRAAIAKSLSDRYAAKARTVLSDSNPEVQKIKTQTANAIKVQSDAKHERLARSADRREPGSIGATVTKPLTANGSSRMSPADTMKYIDSVLG